VKVPEAMNLITVSLELAEEARWDFDPRSYLKEQSRSEYATVFCERFVYIKLQNECGGFQPLSFD
jgi:hypothetical protein